MCVAEARKGRADDQAEDQVVYRTGARHVPRLQRRTPLQVTTGLLGQDTSHLVIGATGHIGPHLIQQLADMGAGTIVAVSRNPAGRLDEVAALSTRDLAGPGGRRRHRRNRNGGTVHRFGTELLHSKASTWRPSPADPSRCPG